MAGPETSDPAADSTAPEDTGEPTRVDSVFRWLLVGVATLAVGAGLLGLMGVKDAEAASAAGGYELAVRYASITRPGLATPFEVTVIRGVPLPERVTLEITSDYLAAFDENGLNPQPVSSFGDGEVDSWQFEIPSGERRLSVAFDARLEPAVQWARTATIALIADGETVTSVDIRTWVMP